MLVAMPHDAALAPGSARYTKEPGRHRPVFLWLNVRPRSSTGLLSAARLRLGTWVDLGACRTHRRTGSHHATSDPVSYRPACDARHRPYSGEMTPNGLNAAAAAVSRASRPSYEASILWRELAVGVMRARLICQPGDSLADRRERPGFSLFRISEEDVETAVADPRKRMVLQR
jgi:hypothetical protein